MNIAYLQLTAGKFTGEMGLFVYYCTTHVW